MLYSNILKIEAQQMVQKYRLQTEINLLKKQFDFPVKMSRNGREELF